MAEGKIRNRTHIIEAKSLRFLQNLFPSEWVQRKMEPDYGIDIDLELFDYEDGDCVTLGEHVFLQVKGTESLELATINPIGAQIYTKKELEEKQLPVLKFAVDVTEENIFDGQRMLARDIKILFDEIGVEIPFPQVVVHKADS